MEGGGAENGMENEQRKMRCYFCHMQVQCSCDVRLQIASAQPVVEGTTLYQQVLPTVDSVRILPITLKEGKPHMTPFFAKKAKQIVSDVRHVDRMETYTNGSIDASIVHGDMYSGHDLVLHRPFCELSLYFNAEKLSLCVQRYMDDGLLREVVGEMFTASVQFQRVLEEVLPKY